ncbi:Transketolase 1 [Marinobacterium sp. xm-a-121]|uniref:transketolase n=1 Tax=unclassified Marinobacterium TaxID=2644139 RepID=UPI00156A7322|nr:MULTISPECIES: transketolase [unclassified Marinobacterium]NRP37536.1 Transketolase 1 [Marinobacterium sp. xm-a-121]NRP99880.1 Transketolase 1 [Marinobacterium sp. xm-v-233]
MKDKYESTSHAIRRIIIDKAYECGQSAHLGGALSMADLLAVLYEKFLNFNAKEPEWEGRDIFILSKGHTVLGYFATLFHYGYFSEEVFSTFQTNGSKLIAHPIKYLKYGVESSNGSLGQGISYASGMALGFRKKGKSNRVYAMLGDGECNEGSVWEAAHLAAVEKLDNLVAIVDQNGFRNDGPTSYQSNQLCEMWKSFGWNAIQIDGHDVAAIENAFKMAQETSDKPTAIVAQTLKGKGIEMMESNNDWHHNRITKATYEKCIADLEG